MAPIWPIICCLVLCGVAPTWACIWDRLPDIDPPPFWPDDGFPNHLRPKRSLDDQSDQDVSQTVAGYLLSHSTDGLLSLSEPIDKNLSAILDRIGPDMRASRDYQDFKDISLDQSKRAWKLLHEHAQLAISTRLKFAKPTIFKILQEAGTSEKCVNAINDTFKGAEEMKSWAVKMLNSWGSFPTSGIFEGTYGDVGAFHTCVNINQNKLIDHAHYCSVTFRPVMASHKDYELIVRKESKDLLMMFESNSSIEDKSQRDVFTDLLDQSQYHHFLYYKWGTCWPIACTPIDVRRIAKLVGRKNILMNGPVKCYSKDEHDYEQEFDDFGETILKPNEVKNEPMSNNTQNPVKGKRKLVISVWDKNNGIFIWKPHFNTTQKVAASILIVLTIFIGTMTLIDLVCNKLPWLYQKLILSLKGLPLSSSDNPNGLSPYGSQRRTAKFALCTQPVGLASPVPTRKHPTQAGFQIVPGNNDVCLDTDEEIRQPSFFMSIVNDCSIFTNFRQFFRVSENQMKTDILCLHGIRCITMVWIILTHTMAYNDWSAFARTREVEVALNSLVSQPLFNGSYLVDTFFLMSGLLSALTAFRHCQGFANKFSSIAFIVGRWLRLTPQIFVMSMVYIVLPSWSYGPHWYPIVGEYSENCVKNWWINVLHMQAFIKTEEMCNFVTWWISIDFSYHFLAVGAIWIILKFGHKWGYWSMVALVVGMIVWQSEEHYKLALPPNVLSTIPQTGAMWTIMTLGFYWKPYTHSVPFFFGFYVGYLLALKTKVVQKHLNTRRALIGWTLAISLLLTQQYSTYWWVTGKADYSKWVSTVYFGACSLAWNGSICWIIIACQHGYGGFIGRMLSWKVFIVLGKASYLVYLSHFQVLFMFFGTQSLLIEPSVINMAYIIVGNIFVATVYGILLCCIYEIPYLKAYRRMMKYV